MKIAGEVGGKKKRGKSGWPLHCSGLVKKEMADTAHGLASPHVPGISGRSRLQSKQDANCPIDPQ